MTATGWRTAITLAAPLVGLYAATFFDSALASGSVLFGVFIAMTSLASLVFRRMATHEERRRELEDRVRNPPS